MTLERVAAAGPGWSRSQAGLPAPTWCQFCAERLIFLTALGCSLFMSLGVAGGQGLWRGPGGSSARTPLGKVQARCPPQVQGDPRPGLC